MIPRISSRLGAFARGTSRTAGSVRSRVGSAVADAKKSFTSNDNSSKSSSSKSQSSLMSAINQHSISLDSSTSKMSLSKHRGQENTSKTTILSAMYVLVTLLILSSYFKISWNLSQRNLFFWPMRGFLLLPMLPFCVLKMFKWHLQTFVSLILSCPFVAACLNLDFFFMQCFRGISGFSTVVAACNSIGYAHECYLTRRSRELPVLPLASFSPDDGM